MLSIALDCVLERFAFLDRGRGAGRRGETERINKHFEQMELFYLAQTICCQVDPCLQAELDSTRREVMEQVAEGPRGLGSIVAPRRAYSPKWSDFQITPEFAGDISTTGRFVSFAASRRLVELHKQQVRVVTNAVQAWKERQHD